MKGQWIIDELRQMTCLANLCPQQLEFSQAQVDAARLVQCVRQRGYVSLVELPLRELMDIQVENGYYGGGRKGVLIFST